MTMKKTFVIIDYTGDYVNCFNCLWRQQRES